MGTKIFALVTIILMSGCAVVPESIQVDKNAPMVNYRQATAKPDDNAGKVARWGGVIARVENLPDATMIEMVHFDLRSYGRPIVSDQSLGRFRVYVDGFVDPILFAQGRAVTFAGNMIGVEEGAVGEHKYLFPTLKSSGFHLWKEIEYVEVSTIYMWPYHGYWGWGNHSFDHRVRIRSSHRQTSGGASSPRNSGQNRTTTSRASRTTTGGNVSGNQKEH